MPNDSRVTDATCRTCGKWMTVLEIRATRADHGCEDHLPQVENQRDDVKRPRNARQPSGLIRGVVAFQVTQVCGDEKPPTSACLPEGRHLNSE